VNKRPVTLTMAAACLLLAALLVFASPFVPRGRGLVGFGAGNRPTGARQAGQNGQGGGFGQGQGQGNDQGGAFTQGNGQGNAQGGFGQGNGQGGFRAGNGQGGGFAAGGGGANAALFRFMTPLRIAEGVIGGLFTLLAALGIWQRKKWGMVLALIAAAAMLLTGAFSVFLPLLARAAGRALGSMLFLTTFISGAEWLSIVGMILALAVAVLVLLPASQKGYIVRPKERRVM
jgi:hypothetical protein